MKINRVSSSNSQKMSKSDSFWMNFYYLLVLYKDVFFLVLGGGVVMALIILVLDFMIPNELKNIDKETTMKLFDELQQTNRHHEAILLMENKGNAVLNDEDNEVVYMTKLSDSYIHTGDYAKAEKMLLDAEKLRKTKSIDAQTLKEVPHIDKFMDFSCTRNIYQFYETIGDMKNQLKYYKIYRDFYNKFTAVADVNELIDLGLQNSEFAQINNDFAFDYDSIVVTSFTDVESAIKMMQNLVDSVYYDEAYNNSFKIKCLNKLIGWQLDNGFITDSYINMALAIELVKNPKNFDDYKYLGELSDYCYQIHDIATSKSLFNRYSIYFEERYGKDDYDYLYNYVRSFRYLETENNWEKLIIELEKYCRGMRRKIATFMPSMTEAQRIFFAEKFDMAYNYAFHILSTHPDERLAKICFDNVIFKKGLLLRSERQIENSILALNNSKIDSLYSRLKELKVNLIYLSVSGKKYTDKTEEFAQEAEHIEKELAMQCSDFKTLNEIEDVDCYNLQSKLSDNEVIIELIEHNGNLFALILDNANKVKYVNIGKKSEINDMLHSRIAQIYHNQSFTDKIWSKIAEIIHDKETVFYVPVGFFNQLSIGSLYNGNDEYLSDNYNLVLVSNPLTIKDKHPLNFDSKTTKISLWGGINYGNNDTTTEQIAVRAAITRGKSLRQLPFTLHEVKEIANLLNNQNINNIVFSDSIATETAFKQRAQKNDNIIHISTHGFFNENSDLNSSMIESGLFFAGANKFWSNDTLEVAIGQEDGILRAAEIAEMNLSNCNLVVLSACETGLGFSNTSEGVYGLQRAFKLAGADMILMSLWKVDDFATSMLMTEFYKNLLSGDDADLALNKSRQSVREQFPSPEDWGGFVLLH